MTCNELQLLDNPFWIFASTGDSPHGILETDVLPARERKVMTPSQDLLEVLSAKY